MAPSSRICLVLPLAEKFPNSITYVGELIGIIPSLAARVKSNPSNLGGLSKVSITERLGKLERSYREERRSLLRGTQIANTRNAIERDLQLYSALGG